MPSAIDVFREQREAAEQLHGRLQEIAALLGHVRQQINSLALNEDLRKMLRDEQDWLTRGMRGGLNRTLPKSHLSGHGRSSRALSSSACSR